MSGKETLCEISGCDRVTPNDYDKRMVLTSKQETLYSCRENPRVGEKLSATLTLQDYVAIKRDEWKDLVLVDDRGPRKLLHVANQEHWREILERWKEFSELKKHMGNIEWDEEQIRHKKVGQTRLKVDELNLLLVDSDEDGVPRCRKHEKQKTHIRAIGRHSIEFIAIHVNVEAEYDDKLDGKPMEAGSVNDPSVKEFMKLSSKNNEMEMLDMCDRKWRRGRESVTEPERLEKSPMQLEKDPSRQPEADVTNGTKLLILGILFGLKYFVYYIVNTPVKVVTDHSALGWINTMANEKS